MKMEGKGQVAAVALAGLRHHRGTLHLASSSAARLWAVLKRFFVQVADVVQDQSPATAEKLRRASPHWTRHTHATHALERGVTSRP